MYIENKRKLRSLEMVIALGAALAATTVQAASIEVLSSSFLSTTDTPSIIPTNPLPMSATQTFNPNPSVNLSSVINLSNTSFSVDVNQTLLGSIEPVVNGLVYFFIQPDAPTGSLTYALAGSYSISTVGNIYLESDLYDLSGSFYPILSYQDSINNFNSNLTLTLGQTNGNQEDGLDGNLTGNLLPGHEYLWIYYEYADVGSGTATGNITLTFGDSSAPILPNDASTVPLPAACWSGLSLVAGMGVIRLLRHRTVARHILIER